MEKLLNIDEVAEILGVNKTTIYSWTSQNRIPHIKLTRRVLKFREKEIMDWISKKSVHGDEPPASKSNRRYTRLSSSLSDDSIERIIRNAKKEVLNRS